MERVRVVIVPSLTSVNLWLSHPTDKEPYFVSLCKGVKNGFKTSNGIPAIGTYVIIRKHIREIKGLLKPDDNVRLCKTYFGSSLGDVLKQEQYGGIIEIYSRQPISKEVLAVRTRSAIAHIVLQNTPSDLELKVVAYTVSNDEPVIRSGSVEEFFFYAIDDRELPLFRGKYLKISKSFEGKKVELSSLTSSSSELEGLSS
jgi:hypothetical protein